MAASDLQLPPGFRFHPTDEELVLHYLCRRCAAQPISVPIIAEIDLYKYDPWELPEMALYGEREWYFFSPRDRKYPNGSRPNRAAGSGYWKATGADKPIGNPKTLAIKKALVFYAGKAPKGEKTNWIMHEYRLADVDRSARKKGSGLRLDDWVLCRIYNKKGVIERPVMTGKNGNSSNTDEVDKKAETDDHPSAGQPSTASTMNDYMQFDTSDSIRHPPGGDSSCSEHVVSPCDKEVQSEPKWGEFGNIEFGYDDSNSLDSAFVPGTGPFQQGGNHFSPLQDMFMFLPKPF